MIVQYKVNLTKDDLLCEAEEYNNPALKEAVKKNFKRLIGNIESNLEWVVDEHWRDIVENAVF